VPQGGAPAKSFATQLPVFPPTRTGDAHAEDVWVLQKRIASGARAHKSLRPKEFSHLRLKVRHLPWKIGGWPGRRLRHRAIHLIANTNASRYINSSSRPYAAEKQAHPNADITLRQEAYAMRRDVCAAGGVL